MIGIIDYGRGNLHSVENALNYIGADCIASSDKKVLDRCDKLILPGVGAFRDAMESLQRADMVSYVKENKRPILGICLGMQLLFDRSYEFGECDGLSLIEGEVVKLEAYQNDRKYKIPHMGWNSLEIRENQPLFKGIESGVYTYFVHSYKCVPKNESDIASTTYYGEEICASVRSGNVFGTQFHPEKSGEKTGLVMLKNFVEYGN